MNTGIESLALSSKQIDFSIIVNEIFDLFNKVDNESEKYKILYCLNNHKITLQEMYNSLLNNQKIKIIQILLFCLEILIIMELKLVLIRKKHLNYIKRLQI